MTQSLKQNLKPSYRVIIDPGHGGRDYGGGSNFLFKEKDWALLVSLAMLGMFGEKGIKTTITRREDVYLDSAERARIVRESRAQICLSNHVNALNGWQSGFEIYHSIYAKPTFAECVAEHWEKAGLQPNKNPIRYRKSEKNPREDYYFMHRLTGSVQTLILEYGYGDNAKDREILMANPQKCARATVDGVLAYLGLRY